MKADSTGGFPYESKIREQCRDMVVCEDIYETSSANLAAFIASLPGSSILDVSNSSLERSVPCQQNSQMPGCPLSLRGM